MYRAILENVEGELWTLVDELNHKTRLWGEMYENLPKVSFEALKIIEEKPKMSVLGLESGLFEKKMAEIRQRVAARQAAGLSKIDNSVDAGISKIDAAADTVVAKVEAEVDAQIQEFAKFGDNGGPA